MKRLAAWVSSVALVVAVIATSPAQADVTPAATGSAIGSLEVASSRSGPMMTADLSRFQPGNIISDAVFFNRGTMSEGQIQSFLEAKVPRCEPGYTCLKDWYDTSRTTTADAMCGAYSGGVRERASAIIYKVAQACGINPQVLLVTLQKEQGLVTHVWPSDWRYTIAMGQGCPDTAACDTRYYGFFNQVYGAAWQLKRYANPPGTSQYFTWYAPGKTWNIRYNPNVDCGSSPVLVQNQATANLYYYTPYQPNAAALRAGYGEGDACSAYGNRNFYNYFTDWFGSTQGGNDNPIGNIESIEAIPGAFRVTGWAADPNTTDSISVHVYVGGWSTAVPADIERPDVGAAYPALGSRHGFSALVPAQGAGLTNVCVYGINSGPGAHVLMGCRSLTAMSGPPIGVFDSVKGVDGGVEVRGWVIDPDLAGPTSVHVYVDSAGQALLADVERPDVASHYPAYGPHHGFAATLPATPGGHNVCAYGINSGPGGTLALGCHRVTVPGMPDLGRAPVGNYESLAVSGSTATARGWALDPDTSAPIPIHLYVGSAGAAYMADKSRPDLVPFYPDHGPNHGFVIEQIALPPGRSDVCAYAINTGPGGHTFLGCRTAVVPTAVDAGRVPFGNYEALVPTAGGATISGWTIDPDTTAPISIHIYVDGVGAPYLADKPRTDVGAAFGMGDNHGFVQLLPMAPGAHRACVYAINNGAGGHVFFGCRDVVVP